MTTTFKHRYTAHAFREYKAIYNQLARDYYEASRAEEARHQAQLARIEHEFQQDVREAQKAYRHHVVTELASQQDEELDVAIAQLGDPLADYLTEA
jgi:nanoRNase/pAp phosphatase (c-di-AMP/oligoRNAs hydrolase)